MLLPVTILAVSQQWWWVWQTIVLQLVSSQDFSSQELGHGVNSIHIPRYFSLELLE